MEHFEIWLDSFKEGVQFFDSKKEDEARKELKNLYGVLLLQNEHFRSEIEDLKERLEV
ncbi:MAG: hypothetical protein JW924_12340 [Fusobacteriaceae bacterium]|nr:hypothetical protein [Fusobacteriaceae bacterium]